MKTRFKKGFKKVVILLACIFLMASFFVLPVSADSWGAEFHVLMNQMAREGDVAYSSGTSTQSPVNYLDANFWDTLTSNNSSFVRASEGEYDYQYFYFNVDKRVNKANLVMSYALYDIYLPYIEWEFGNQFRISAGSLNFFSSANIAITDIRFSIRAFNPSDSQILDVRAISDTFRVTGRSGISSMREYFIQVDSIVFKNVGLKSLPAPAYCLCIDFIFTPLQIEDSFGIGIDTRSEFYVWNFPQAYGPQEAPYHPGLDNPIYKNPDTSYLDELLSIQNDTLGSLSTGNDGMLDVYDSFKSNLGSFGSGLSNVSILLSYFISEIPAFEFIIIFSLCLGLVSFVLGLGSSIVGAGVRSFKRSSDRSNQSKTNDQSKGSKSSKSR